MGTASQTTIRRLGPGDEQPVGFAFGYVLLRRHGKPASMFLHALYASLGGTRVETVMWDF